MCTLHACAKACLASTGLHFRGSSRGLACAWVPELCSADPAMCQHKMIACMLFTGCTTWRFPPHSCWGKSSKVQIWTHRPTWQRGGCAETSRAAHWPAVKTSCCASASISCSATARTAPRRPLVGSSSCQRPSSCCLSTAWACPSHPASGVSSWYIHCFI